jgi:hypothetical protein
MEWFSFFFAKMTVGVREQVMTTQRNLFVKNRGGGGGIKKNRRPLIQGAPAREGKNQSG